MNAKETELEAILKAGVDTAADRELEERAVVERAEFVRRFPLEELDKLTLDKYCIGKGDRDNFCWWIEIGTTSASKYFPGNSTSYGVYWSQKDNAYCKVRRLTEYAEKHPGASEDEVFAETLAAFSANCWC